MKGGSQRKRGQDKTVKIGRVWIMQKLGGEEAGLG